MTRDEWFTLMERPTWQKRAACRGYSVAAGNFDLFYLDPGENGDDAINTFCNVCPVRCECLAYALNTTNPTHRDHGIWGGTTAKDRHRIRARWAS